MVTCWSSVRSAPSGTALPRPVGRARLWLVLSAALLPISSEASPPAPPGDFIVLDPQHQAHTFDGVGALSAGASSRLLWDYSEEVRNRILDLLFKPNYGASLHILKVEIGGDTQSTDGSEPSHEHEAGDLDCSRGYESWLIKEAKKRQPDIITYGLSWGVPGWVGNGSFFSADNVRYQVDWLKCMRQETQVDVDYLGIWNERPWGNVDYTLQLRSALDAAGFRATQLVMLDGGNDTGFLNAMDSNPTFRSAFSAVGLHYPCNTPMPDVLTQGKRFWSSEEASVPATWGGAGCWGRSLNQNYLRMNMTASIAWSLVWSAYPNLDCFGNGLLYAFQPWSGLFSANAPVWVTAHTTQFTRPGWRYLRPGSGHLPLGGTAVALTDGLGNLTLILETLVGSCMYHDGCPHSKQPASSQLVAFQLVGRLRTSRLVLWLTNQSHQFVQLPSVPVAADGSFRVRVPFDTVLTLTSPGNAGRQSKADGAPLPQGTDSGETTPFPLPFHEDFEAYPRPVSGRTATYFADQSGSWEASGGSLHQVVARRPGRNRWTCNSDPFTLVGGVNWTAYVASVKARIAAAAGPAAYVALCVRVARYPGFQCGDIPGYCLRLGAQGWALTSAGTSGSAAAVAKVLSSGKDVLLVPGSWSKLEVKVQGTSIEASVDGKLLAKRRSTVMSVGQVALQSGWHRADFDDLEVQSLAPPKPDTTAFRALSLWTRNWAQPSCWPVPRDAGRGARNDYSGYVGMRLRVLKPVVVVALGRWRSDGDSQNHKLLLLGDGNSASVELPAAAAPDDVGFAYAEVPEVELQPGVYLLLSHEFAGGDHWFDEGVVLEEEDWVQVVSSVFGTSPEAVQSGSAHTTFGPVNVRLRRSAALVKSVRLFSEAWRYPTPALLRLSMGLGALFAILLVIRRCQRPVSVETAD